MAAVAATATAATATATTDRAFQSAVTEWLEDCYRSDGVYAGHITALTHYICNKSPELRSIRFAIRARAAAFLHFCLRILAVGAQQGLPVIAGMAAASTGWRMATVSAERISPLSNFDKEGIETTAEEGRGWSISAEDTGAWLGDQVNGILTVAWRLVGTFVDRSLHLQETAGNLQRGALQIIIPALLAITAYWATYLFLTLVLQIHTLAEKEQTLRRAQAAFLQESEALVGRTLIETLRPPLLQILGGLLAEAAAAIPSDQSRRLALTYSSNYTLLRSAIYDELIGGVQGLEFSEILAKNRLSAMYFQELFYLMRNADEEVSRILFRFNQALSAVEGDPLSRVMAGGTQRIQALLNDAH